MTLFVLDVKDARKGKETYYTLPLNRDPGSDSQSRRKIGNCLSRRASALAGGKTRRRKKNRVEFSKWQISLLTMKGNEDREGSEGEAVKKRENACS